MISPGIGGCGIRAGEAHGGKGQHPGGIQEIIFGKTQRAGIAQNGVVIEVIPYGALVQRFHPFADGVLPVGFLLPPQLQPPFPVLALLLSYIYSEVPFIILIA